MYDEEEEDYEEEAEAEVDVDDQDSGDWSSLGDLPPSSPSPSTTATAGGGSQTEASASVAPSVSGVGTRSGSGSVGGTNAHLRRRVEDGTRPDARVAWSQSIESSSSSGGRKGGTRRGISTSLRSHSHDVDFDANTRRNIRSYQGRDAFSTAQLIEKEDRAEAVSDDSDSLDSHSVATSLVVEVIFRIRQ